MLNWCYEYYRHMFSRSNMKGLFIFSDTYYFYEVHGVTKRQLVLNYFVFGTPTVSSRHEIFKNIKYLIKKKSPSKILKVFWKRIRLLRSVILMLSKWLCFRS